MSDMSNDGGVQHVLDSLKSMDQEAFQKIVDNAWSMGLDMACLGQAIRQQYNATWDPRHDLVMGALTCAEALRGLAPVETETDEETGTDEETTDGMSVLTPEAIIRHNERIRAWVTPIKQAAENMPVETCEACIRFMSAPGTAAGFLGTLLRGRLEASWDADQDVAAGMRIYCIALERLDKYDVDFRPRPDPVEMLSSTTADGMSMTVFYLPQPDEFQVVLSRGDSCLKETFPAGYRPTFGMEVSDHAQATAIAERLARLIEAGESN